MVDASWGRAVVAAAGNWAFDYLALISALYAVGANPRLSLVLLAYAGAAVLSMIPITPGGFGFVEAGLVWLLVVSGISAQNALLATAAYRAVSLLFPVLMAAPAFLAYRARYRSGDNDQEPAAKIDLLVKVGDLYRTVPVTLAWRPALPPARAYRRHARSFEHALQPHQLGTPPLRAASAMGSRSASVSVSWANSRSAPCSSSARRSVSTAVARSKASSTRRAPRHRCAERCRPTARAPAPGPWAGRGKREACRS